MAINLIDDAGVFNNPNKSNNLIDDAGIFEKTNSPAVSNQSSILPGQEDTEQKIGSRGNLIQDLVKDPTTLGRLQKHPVGTTLRTLGGAFDYLEGFPSSIAIDLQQGKPENILKNLTKVATGERVPQRGDILRNLGINEFASSTIGLLSGGAKLSPDTALGKIIFENPAVNKLGEAISKYGVSGFSKAISIFGGIPQEKVTQALNNPNFLSSSWVKKNLTNVQNQYNKVVNPLIQDNSNRVNTSRLNNVTEELGLIQKNGEFTKAFESMNKAEQKRFLDWENKIHSKDMSFNEADSLIGQMDEALSATYKAKDAGKTVDYSDDFVRNTTQLRNKLNEVMKQQYPEFGKIKDEYSMVKTAQSVYKHFDRGLPHFLPAITVNAGAATLGGLSNPTLFGIATLGAIPKLQAQGIKTASLIGKNAEISKGLIGRYLSTSGIKGQAINRLND